MSGRLLVLSGEGAESAVIGHEHVLVLVAFEVERFQELLALVRFEVLELAAQVADLDRLEHEQLFLERLHPLDQPVAEAHLPPLGTGRSVVQL